MRLLPLLLAISLALPAHAAWYSDTDFAYRQKITVDNTKVGANLTDFPIYVNTDDLAAGFYTHAQSDCDDVRITKSDETTEVAREIVFCDGADGEIHFKAAGTLSGSVDTDYYIYYGNAGASDYATSATYGAENVWSDYVAVWHNQEDPSGSAPQVLDSTANNQDFTSGGSMTSGDSIAGKIGKALDFDGSDDYLTTADTSGLDLAGTSYTYSAWFNSTNATPSPIVSKLTCCSASSSGWAVVFTDASGGLRMLGYNSTAVTVATTTATGFDDGAWHIFHATQDGSTRADLYVDGGADGADTSVNTLAAGTYVVNQATRGNTGTNTDVDVDEFRVRASLLSSTWITTEYNNQNSSSTFYTAAAEESAPSSGPPVFWWNGF
jgi:hypothetical protein